MLKLIYTSQFTVSSNVTKPFTSWPVQRAPSCSSSHSQVNSEPVTELARKKIHEQEHSAIIVSSCEVGSLDKSSDAECTDKFALKSRTLRDMLLHHLPENHSHSKVFNTLIKCGILINKYFLCVHASVQSQFQFFAYLSLSAFLEKPPFGVICLWEAESLLPLKNKLLYRVT